MNFGIGESYWRNQHIFSFNGDNIEQSEIAQMLHEAQTRVEVGDLTHLSTIVYGNDSYNAAGNLSHYQYEKLAKGENDEEENSSYVFSYSYAYGNAHEAYQNTLVSGSGSGENHKNGTTRTHYNASHQAIKTIEAYADDTGQITTQQHRYFRNNGDGKIIFKGWGEYDTSTQVYTEEDQRHYYYAQNELIGSIGKNGRILFDEVAGYQIASSENAGNAGSYTVQHGDTLKSIARLVYGSEALWYVIADANGMADSNPKLEAGQTLKTPSFATNVNDVDTFKAYNMDEIIGDRTPAISDVPPPPPADDGCGIIGQIIMIVVIIVVTVYTAGAAANAFAGTSGGLWSAGSAALAGGGTTFTAGIAAGAAAIGGFVGNVAGQLVGKALGVVESFSLRQAVSSGLTSAATAGIGSQLKDASLFSESGKLDNWGRAAAAAINVPVGYAINKVVGLPSSFQWRNVTSAYVSSGIQNGVFGLGDIETSVNPFIEILRAGISHEVQKGFGGEGKWEPQQVIANAFGTAIGNAIVEGFKAQETTDNTAEAIQTAVEEVKLESPSAPPEVVQKAVEDKLRALGVDTSQVSVSPSSERDGFIDVEVNGETRSFNVGGVTSAEVAANLQGHLKDFLGEHYSQNSQILNLDQRLNQYRFDDNRERAKFNTEAAFEAGIVRGQLQTKYANEAMMAQIKATSFHIDNQAELSDYFATYDRSLEIAGQRAFTGDALNVGLALTTFAAGGAATWAGWGGIGVISQGAGKGFGALKSGLGWTVNGVSNVARTLGGNFSKHGIKGIYATGSYYGSSIQTGGVILADIVAGEGVGLASYGFASYATAKLAYSNRGQILSGISEGFRSVGKFVDGISAQFSLSFRSGGLGGASSSLSSELDRGVAFFGKDNLRYYASNADGSAPKLGAQGRGFFFMPIDDAARLNSPVRVATETGFAPSAQRAWLNGDDIYGVSFPLDGLTPRTPTKVDADGWRHFLEGGHTAVNAEGTNSFIVNQTREFVIDGGIQMPKDTQLFRLGSNGEWIPLWNF